MWNFYKKGSLKKFSHVRAKEILRALRFFDRYLEGTRVGGILKSIDSRYHYSALQFPLSELCFRHYIICVFMYEYYGLYSYTRIGYETPIHYSPFAVFVVFYRSFPFSSVIHRCVNFTLLLVRMLNDQSKGRRSVLLHKLSSSACIKTKWLC